MSKARQTQLNLKIQLTWSLLEDGERYQIHFPMKDGSAGFILDENGFKCILLVEGLYMTL
jgi:hypothetical protein